MSVPRLEVRNLSKTFSGVTVLDSAHLALEPGEIHGLIGQNGSGKSTLIKLISGVYRPDPGGEVLVDGKHIGAAHAATLHHEGLAFVHQDLGLVLDLSVRENVRVGRHATRGILRWIDTDADRRAVERTFDFLGVQIDPEARVATLDPSERVAVAVARALQERAEGSGVIVFDESSRAIPHEALPAFYDTVRFLADHGTSVLIVSHDLKEVLSLCDRVTALRNGRVVETGLSTATLDEAALTRLVLGRDGEVGDLVEQMPPHLLDEQIEFNDVTGGRVRGFSATVRCGEVVGVTGSVNSGLLDLAGLVSGAHRARGRIVVDGTSLDLSRARVADRLRTKIATIPQDRALQGLATTLTVEENVTVPHLRDRGRPWWTGRSWQRAEVDAVLDTYGVTPRDGKAVVATMSGGNQQKVLFGKWLLGNPKLLVLDEPTQAVDVGARRALLEAARQAAARGTAILLCSSEIEDLTAVCDRVLVLQDGVVAHDLHRPFSAESILEATFTDPAGHTVIHDAGPGTGGAA